MRIRVLGEEYLERFLLNAHFDNASCFAAMEDIKDIYHRNMVDSYTVGNSQKWVTMTIKYYFILKSINGNTVNLQAILSMAPFNQYKLFPVDSKIIKLVSRTRVPVFNLHGCSWHTCDNLDYFQDFWENLERSISRDFVDIPFVWELISWVPSAKALAKPQIYHP